VGNGNANLPGPADLLHGGGPFFIAVSDLDADGKADLVVACREDSAGVSVSRGNGNGPTFVDPAVCSRPAPGLSPAIRSGV